MPVPGVEKVGGWVGGTRRQARTPNVQAFLRLLLVVRPVCLSLPPPPSLSFSLSLSFCLCVNMERYMQICGFTGVARSICRSILVMIHSNIQSSAALLSALALLPLQYILPLL